MRAHLRGRTAIIEQKLRFDPVCSVCSRKRWDNDSAFPKRKLCLNLVSPSEDSDLEYDFQFLTKKEYEQIDEKHAWFVVGEILNLTEAADVNEYLVDHDISTRGKDSFRFANKSLFKLYEVIHV